MSPLAFPNDGSDVAEELLGEAVNEIVDQFNAATFHRQTVEGHWRHDETHFRDDLAIIVIDVPDTVKNREWMRARAKLARPSESVRRNLHQFGLPPAKFTPNVARVQLPRGV